MPVTPLTQTRTLALDADRLGAIAGGVIALLVALVQMFLRDADPLTTVTRSGWAFVGAYAAVFYLVRTILRTTLFEMLGEKTARREAKREQMREARENAAAMLNATGATPPEGANLPPIA
jgi:hypothetical protein